MDKNAIKKYAVWARRELISRVGQRAALYEITEQGYGDASADSVLGRVMSAEEKSQRQALIAQIRDKGYEQVMEEIAYTWFNRFIALRFMEVNGYLPAHVRVFTDDENNFKPQILTEAINMELDGLDMEKVYALKNANDDDALFKYLIIVQCNALSGILPGMFQRISDYTELLFPDNLLREGSVVEQMVAMIPEEDWTDQVQIIGWLYQYYNTEPKDQVFANLKKNIKITKENIPAATQLFTPDWIVHYMVENSLGRLWIEHLRCGQLSSTSLGEMENLTLSEMEHRALGPVSEDALAKKFGWKYYLAGAEQEPEVEAELAEIRKEYAALKPEEIKVIDPCCGSGHILCVLFDVLIQIYEDYGYTAREAAQSIVRLNLYGLDIDPRATQLAYFSVMMKARQYDRRFFSRNIQPMVYSPEGYPDGLEYGSLITVDKLEEAPDFEHWNLFDGNYDLAQNRWNFRYVLSQKYHVVVTNPPYMGSSSMGPLLGKYVKDNYPDSKSDLFAVFIERCREMTAQNGFQAMITQHAWMFLSSFEKLRIKLQTLDTINMAHLGARAFDEIGGEVVQTTSFVFSNSHIRGYKGTYCRLIEPTTQQGKEDMFLAGENRYTAQQDNFSKIPGAPVVYWLSDSILNAFSDSENLIGKCALPKQGSTLGDNASFVRMWYEIGNRRNKWFNCMKGGEYRRWYGNTLFILDWEENGARVKSTGRATIRSEKLLFQEGITWSNITSGQSSFRYMPEGFFFESTGSVCFVEKEYLWYLLGFLNSPVCQTINKAINPTLHLQSGDVAKLPLIKDDSIVEKVSEIVKYNVNLCKIDWDSFETSWDFKTHPLIAMIPKGGAFFDIGNIYLSECYLLWEGECEERFNRLKANEEELNRIFIDIYGLQDELTPEVEDKDVTVRRADLQREIRSLISYAVGCMFGRYSLNAPGLAYAGGAWDASQYTTFQPDTDAIIPICDDEYFEDDIVGRFVKFIEVVYGGETLEENLKFIADALGGKGSPREVIRSYFINGFYADHLKVYQKRPIYWLFDSGKKNGFKCLIYMHRYQPDTIARIRTDYVHEQQSRYRTAIADLENRIANAATGERVKLSKQMTKLQTQAKELRVYEEKIHHLADQMIRIDLDDGVKHNYAIFQDVLAKIK